MGCFSRLSLVGFISALVPVSIQAHLRRAKTDQHRASGTSAACTLLVVVASLVATPAFSEPLNGITELPFGAFVPSVDTSSKHQVALLYHQFHYWQADPIGNGLYEHITSHPLPLGWDGSTENCVGGTISPAYRQQSVRQLNFFRALSGLTSARVGDDAAHAKTQAAALITGANITLDHAPTSKSKCFSSAGLAGAQTSNLSLVAGTPFSLRSFLGYMSEPGANNAAVGHRRWLLFPGQYSFTTGITDFRFASDPSLVGGANAIGIMNNSLADKTGAIPYSSPKFVAWPSPGYFPFLLLPSASNRWSFSCTGCDFSLSTVDVRKDGVLLPAPTVSPQPAQYGDPSIVFQPSGVEYPVSDTSAYLTAPTRDIGYEVMIKNVKTGGTTRDYTYKVTVFDPVAYAASTVMPKWNLTDMWWNENESGWGIALNQGITGQLFGAWYTYDDKGMATWATMPGGTWVDSKTFTGTLYQATGTPYSTVPFVSANTQARVAGNMTIRFTSDSTAQMEYVLNGVAATKTISRFKLSAPKYVDGKNFTGLWWSQSESGWGASLTQQFDTIFGAFYIYDEAGLPTWFTLPGGQWTSKNTYVGNIYTTSGPAFNAPFDPARVQGRVAGDVKITFVTDYEANVIYTLNGNTVTKMIMRNAF